MNVDLIGYIAGILVTISLLPQVIKSWKTKSTKDLSLLRYLIYIAAVTLWLIYGFARENGPMMAMNVIILSLALSILYLKLKYK